MSTLRNILPFILSIGFVTGSVPLLGSNWISSNNSAENKITYRLTGREYVKPTHYEIQLKPNLGDFNFNGETTISITITGNNTEEIVLHSRNLTIDEASTKLKYYYNDTTIIEQKIKAHSTDSLKEFLIIQLDTALIAGNYELTIKYNGTLKHDDLNGFYRSSYLNARGEKVWLAATQFEPTHARRAFPCFDEPALKATFKISINHFQNYTAVSNMPIEKIVPDTSNPAKRWSHFSITPSMSTYLVAFVISDFKSSTSENGRLSIWSKPDDIDKTSFALEIGEKTLTALDKYTGIEHYSIINKMDNFAIPDFRAGAMENWGIVTYRESALLYEENVTSTSQKQSIATIISHEFAHQWFGDLVSPSWWDVVWLNEGFANYFQHVITDQVEKSWQLMNQFVVKNFQETAFTADDKEDAHPMNGVNIDSPSSISKFFDSITYSKAGSVIRMIAHAINETTFQEKIKSYLKNNSYKAVNSKPLFDELINGVTSGGLSGEDLRKAFMTWTDQPGYPVITVTRNYETGFAGIKQHRFLTSKDKNHTESWVVPINYATRSDTNFEDTKPSQWLKAGVDSSISGLKKDDWVIVNRQQTGYYRVNYDGDNWKLITNQLKNSSEYAKIHVLNRAQLLDDSFKLVQAGELANYSVFFELSTYLEHEIDYIPWYAAFRAFTVLDRVLAQTESHARLKLYIQKLITKLESNVGFDEIDGDDHIMKLNRIGALKWASYVGSQKYTSQVSEKFVGYIRGSSELSSDLRGVTLCAGVRGANSTISNELLSLYEKTKNANERNEIISAIGCSTDSETLNAFLDASIIEKFEITPDKAIQSVAAGSNAGVDIAFDFIDKNYERLYMLNKNKTESVTKILNDIGSRMTTEAHIQKLQKFIENHNDLAEDLKSNALKSANKNLKWIKKFEGNIGVFLKKQIPDNDPDKSGSNTSFKISLTQLTFFGFVASLIMRINWL